MDAQHAWSNLDALLRAEARRPRTPGVNRWFIVLSAPEEIEYGQTVRIRVPRMPQ